MTILGTRPEIIRLSRVMARLDATDGVDHIVVHTGQNYDYELNEIFFEDLGVRAPDRYLEVSTESLGATYGEILSKSEEAMRNEQPDAVLILGDTNSAIAAIIAKRMHIPVFHMEAGNRSFDRNVPEEVNRRVVDHTADFNLVYTEHARRNLLAEGLPPRNIYLTGSPMREVLDHQAARIAASSATADLDLDVARFFLISAHREENVDNPKRLAHLVTTLRDLAERHGYPVLVSLHPRTRKRLGELLGGDLDDEPLLRFHKPFGFSDYCRLQLDAACVLSDSGTITEESAILGFPAVTIRDSIERPEGLDAGTLVLAGLESSGVLRAVEERMAATISTAVPVEYQVDDTSIRVVRLLLGLAAKTATWSGIHART